ncbi:hypothetical protein DBR32_05630 [Taibaiella sp. KBW10]|uniref:carboxypeptidase-like regulatory domain-containing protein n=1 Tax=Taibaiella sp. KBW10 TaxID=2153357 RepID=UPI000F5A2301|nr:carboxypeptidase-like regulatory domain-containing protein [Taibaiella sp. KBW10]RQO31442.1 hypothetical protein DBR32_05630 [Taibaiella sp. KBW10]
MKDIKTTGLCTILCILFVWPAAWGKTVTGRVIDQATQVPISACAVYINNTTIGTTTDEKGYFTLSYAQPLPVNLVFQSLGYELKSMNLKEEPLEPLQVVLQVRTEELSEVNVLSPLKNGWAQYGQDFMENFIGYSDWAKDCEIVNKKAIVFRFDNLKQILYVQAKEPIRIRHKQLGYTIYYDLIDFTKDYAAQKAFYSGYSRYVIDQIKQKKRINTVSQNRKSAYDGSLNHFIRSVYKNSILPEGFEVRVLQRIRSTEYGKYMPVWVDTLNLSRKEDLSRLVTRMTERPGVDTAKLIPAFLALKAWLSSDTGSRVSQLALPMKDSMQTAHDYYSFEKTAKDTALIVTYYDHNRLSPQDSITAAAMKNISFSGKPEQADRMPYNRVRYMDILYTDILPSDSFRVSEAGAIILAFKGYLHVTYTRELEEAAYLKRLSPYKHIPAKQQTSIITILNDNEIPVLEDGNYLNFYDLFLEGYWSYEKLDKQLPLDYKP